MGKHVFYVPEDSEGCDTFSPQGCKFPAVINNIPTVFNTSTGLFEFTRDAKGRILVDLSISRAASKGGDFNKDDVPFSAGSDKGQARPISNLDSRGVF